jgi:hypothetical protein
MILLVAGRSDIQARWLVERWARHDARLLEVNDLSQPGWCFRPSCPEEWTGVVGGQRFDNNSGLSGVLNCLTAITDDQLLHVVPEDRAYVACEMTAFLLAWETELTCPVFNRPTPNCLIGPNLSREEWILMAARLGIPVTTITRSSHQHARAAQNGPIQNARSVTVIGRRALGDGPELQYWARSLARAAGVELATFYFSGAAEAEFLGASLRPDLTNCETADVLLQCFEGVHTC